MNNDTLLSGGNMNDSLGDTPACRQDFCMFTPKFSSFHLFDHRHNGDHRSMRYQYPSLHVTNTEALISTQCGQEYTKTAAAPAPAPLEPLIHILKVYKEKIELTDSAGSLLGAEGFSTNEFPEGSSTTMVKGSSLSMPVLIIVSRAMTCAIWMATYRRRNQQAENPSSQKEMTKLSAGKMQIRSIAKVNSTYNIDQT